MIQSIVESNFNAKINTKANQIMPNNVIDPPHGVLRFLFKFTNDMSGKIIYVYPNNPIVYNRFTNFDFEYNASPDMFGGQLNLKLAGYWKYEIYEVYWEEQPMSYDDTSPTSETDILPADPTNGVVKGLVAIGKMYAKEITGKEEVQYTEYVEPTNTNYIYTGD
jgi:hypothetical protein